MKKALHFKWISGTKATDLQETSRHSAVYSQQQTDYSPVWWYPPLERSSISHSASLEIKKQNIQYVVICASDLAFQQLHKASKRERKWWSTFPWWEPETGGCWPAGRSYVGTEN